ncbi:hypothetical protein L9F63_019901, partial [Diploptera punctata]
ILYSKIIVIQLGIKLIHACCEHSKMPKWFVTKYTYKFSSNFTTRIHIFLKIFLNYTKVSLKFMISAKRSQYMWLGVVTPDPHSS